MLGYVKRADSRTPVGKQQEHTQDRSQFYYGMGSYLLVCLDKVTLLVIHTFCVSGEATSGPFY